MLGSTGFSSTGSLISSFSSSFNSSTTFEGAACFYSGWEVGLECESE